MVSPEKPDSPSDEQVLESLDFEPPCGYPQHAEVGKGGAVWLITFKPVTDCCLTPTAGIRLFCDACWAYRNKADATRCKTCSAVYSPMQHVLAVERLR